MGAWSISLHVPLSDNGIEGYNLCFLKGKTKSGAGGRSHPQRPRKPYTECSVQR